MVSVMLGKRVHSHKDFFAVVDRKTNTMLEETISDTKEGSLKVLGLSIITTEAFGKDITERVAKWWEIQGRLQYKIRKFMIISVEDYKTIRKGKGKYGRE